MRWQRVLRRSQAATVTPRRMCIVIWLLVFAATGEATENAKVAEVVYSRHAFADLERLADFLIKDAPQAAVTAIDVIRDGIHFLERHPFVGRPCEEGLRELLISYGKSGYVALYSYEQSQDVVLVLAIRHQRVAGYST
jgi:plasmid stabilization system protein ParE